MEPKGHGQGWAQAQREQTQTHIHIHTHTHTGGHSLYNLYKRQGPSLGPSSPTNIEFSLQNIDNLAPPSGGGGRLGSTLWGSRGQGRERLEGTVSAERGGATGGGPEAAGPGSGGTRVGPLRSVFLRGGGSLVSLVGAEGTTGGDGAPTGVL